jgi:hypothetical protein
VVQDASVTELSRRIRERREDFFTLVAVFHSFPNHSKRSPLIAMSEGAAIFKLFFRSKVAVNHRSR